MLRNNIQLDVWQSFQHVLNEVLSLNAQESTLGQIVGQVAGSSMKS